MRDAATTRKKTTCKYNVLKYGELRCNKSAQLFVSVKSVLTTKLQLAKKQRATL